MGQAWHPNFLDSAATVLVGGQLRWSWVWNVQSSVTKTCEYHDIFGYFGISKVIFKFETSSQVELGSFVKLGFLIMMLNMHIPI